MRNALKTARSRRGFTLVEIIVAMAIIGILIGIAIYGISQALQESRDTQRRALADSVQKAVVIYQSKYQTLPTAVSVAYSTTTGKSTITVGTGTRTEVFEFNYKVNTTVPATETPTGAVNTDEANLCFRTATGSYAIGVKLESGNWYYVTTGRCQ